MTSWATRTFGFAVVDRGSDGAVTDLVLPGLRRNPRRAHLLVSTVLGKHIAVEPSTVIEAGHRLGAVVREVLDDDVDVLGMAETATSLGHCAADRLDAAVYLHTTRRPAPPELVYAGFQEGHSHATDHTLQPLASFESDRPLVIIDDEISTGTTALAAIRALHCRHRRRRYVVASLVDVREPHHEQALAQAIDELGVPIEHVSLAVGRVMLPPEMIGEVNALPAPRLNVAFRDRPGTARRIEVPWPASVPDGGRHGFARSDRPAFDDALAGAVGVIGKHLDSDRPVLVVGHEEFMYLPLRVADKLAASRPVRFQSSTRSPAYVHDVADYALRRGYQFSACEPGDDAPRFLYNGWPGAQLLLMVDAVADTLRLNESGGIVDVLTGVGYDVLVAAVHPS